MLVSLCIIAMNEQDTIAGLIRSVAEQTVLSEGYDFEFVVVSNGCTDNTAQVAQAALEESFGETSVRIRVHDTPDAGKSRSWNLAVHSILDAATDIIVFMDADIELIDANVIRDLVWKLANEERLSAVSGWPVKDIAKKSSKSLIDRFSLKISSQTPAPHSINGSLYAGRAKELRKAWLPVPTPGEDGFLSAMLHTEGFSQAAQFERIQRFDRPTHYFEAHSISGFFHHEQRMTIGTTVNGWLCEKFWAEEHVRHIGPVIRDFNENDPQWVNNVVASKVAGKTWALPPRLLTWRLHNLRNAGFMKAAARVPFSILATLLNIWPCIQANRALKRQGSASIW
ncbi:MAG: glycosyltransferase [Parasphingorhabdus sp.]|uniref:glycosyltransferase family 2 protein n=1 Tax=Parasphingorhabdus sp. TaxID=2709688 RepID=UPI003001CBEC